MMIYTSGTTGQPHALHAHRVPLGHLPGVQMPHEFLPQPGDRLWTPADWAWAGASTSCCRPFRRSGRRAEFDKFDPEEAFRLMADHGVRNTFVPPTALRMLRAVTNPAGRFDLKLRTVASGGEALGAETFAWTRGAGAPINEFYGQPVQSVLVSRAAIGVAKPGAIGRAVPGHQVAVIREDGMAFGTRRAWSDRGASPRSRDVPVLLE